MKTQNVMIKGTKSGLSLQLNDRCSYDEILSELEEKLSELQGSEESQLISVRVLTGYRYLTAGQEEELKELIRQKKNLIVEEIESDVITKEDARKMAESQEVTSVAAIIRSGQVLEVAGDLLLVGMLIPAEL